MVEECEICFKQYSKKELIRHIRISHKGVRYSCDETGCEKLFTNKNNLNKHKKVTHGNGNEKFKCDLCDNQTHLDGSLELELPISR